MDKIYKGTIGTEFRFYAGADLSDATVLTIFFKKPSGATGSWTDGTMWDGTWLDKDGNIDPKYDKKWFRHITEDGDLDEGNDETAWEFQIYIEMPSFKGPGEKDVETIYETLY